MDNEGAPSHIPQAGSKKKKWMAYAGIGAFMFFLIKGLLWLIVPAALIWWGVQ